MKTALALLISFAGLALAQDEAVPAKRVESVTWDLQAQKLVWVVKNGVQKNGEFVPSTEERYEISPQQAAMAFQGEQRDFSSDEAAWLRRVLDVLTIYCAESVIWWQTTDNPPATQPAPGASQKTKVLWRIEPKPHLYQLL